MSTVSKTSKKGGKEDDDVSFDSTDCTANNKNGQNNNTDLMIFRSINLQYQIFDWQLFTMLIKHIGFKLSSY